MQFDWAVKNIYKEKYDYSVLSEIISDTAGKTFSERRVHQSAKNEIKCDHDIRHTHLIGWVGLKLNYVI